MKIQFHFDVNLRAFLTITRKFPVQAGSHFWWTSALLLCSKYRQIRQIRVNLFFASSTENRTLEKLILIRKFANLQKSADRDLARVRVTHELYKQYNESRMNGKFWNSIRTMRQVQHKLFSTRTSHRKRCEKCWREALLTYHETFWFEIYYSPPPFCMDEQEWNKC